MKILIVLFLVLLAGCGPKPSNQLNEKIIDVADYPDMVNTGQIKEDTLKGSPIRVANGKTGSTEVKITYGSPGIRNRVIWGGVVPFDQVWVTGAHNATSITFSHDVIIDDTRIPKGTYAFFTIPGKEHWQVIINKNYQQHLADQYDTTEDLVRFTVSPDMLSEPTPRLTYEIIPLSDTVGTIVMRWEKLQINIPFTTIN